MGNSQFCAAGGEIFSFLGNLGKIFLGNFGELPNPTNEENEIANNNEDEIMKILNKSDSSNDNSETSRIESLILEEINKE